VTARVDEINFLKPIVVGDLVLIDSALTFVSSRSMEVRVQVYTEAPKTGVREKALTAYFIMVALDDNDRPAQIPSLIITSEEEERLFAEGKARYEAHKAARQTS
jgi:acyl-CoA hydrolase